MSARNSYVGNPINRIEDRRFLRGAGIYVGDLNGTDLTHAAIVRSPVAHGSLRGIDAAAARAMPGVIAVITAAEIGAVPRIPIRLAATEELKPFAQPVIADAKVRYVGEPVAIVVADTAGRAEDAARAVVVYVDPLPPVTGRAAAGSSLLFESFGSNHAISYFATKGDADAAFRDAPYVRREKFAVHRHSAVTMEPRGLLARWDSAAGRMTLFGAAKVAWANRKMLAGALGLAEDAVELVENDVGGGFGVRGEFYPEDFLVPFAARFTGRPVKWVEDRRENLIASNHAREADCEIEIACKRDGTILGLRGKVWNDIGAYMRTTGAIGPRNVAQFLSGAYRVPAIAVEALVMLSNKTPTGTYRGPGRFEADFFRERLFDLVAADLGIDRVEFRRRNLPSAAEMPYRLADIAPAARGDELDSGDYQVTLERCLAEFGWEEKQKLSGKLIDGVYHGLGFVCFIEGGAAGPSEMSRMVLEADGTISVYVGSSSVGQGVETAFSQIVADALQVPIEKIRGIFHGSTAHVREGYGSFHSRAVVMGGSAMLLAAAKLLDGIRAAAAAKLGCAAADVVIEDGERATAGGRSVALADLAGVTAEGEFHNHKHTWAYGAHAAHVAVDPATGAVQVVDYAAVEDAGRIINPKMLRGQLYGAVAQGLGGVFMEHFTYDDQGQPQSTTLADYVMPTACEVPRIKAVVLEDSPSPINPLGAKGAGEGGIIPTGGVIANAIADALSSIGVQPHDLPLSPPRVLRMIEDAKAKA